MPAVDGINGKLDAYGGGAGHSNGFSGTSGSLSVPLAHQWGLQLDAGVGGNKGIASEGGGGHLFWRDPSIGLIGAYGSYSHWEADGGIDLLGSDHVGVNTARVAAEGEYYVSRWNLSAVAGMEMVDVNSTLLRFSVPDRFFDSARASYYLTDNFDIHVGHAYTFGTHSMTLGSEYGLALGEGRTAALFTEGLIGERGNNAIFGGLRIYFGQRDKTLMERHRQDDPPGDLIRAQAASFEAEHQAVVRDVLAAGHFW